MAIEHADVSLMAQIAADKQPLPLPYPYGTYRPIPKFGKHVRLNNRDRIVYSAPSDKVSNGRHAV